MLTGSSRTGHKCATYRPTSQHIGILLKMQLRSVTRVLSTETAKTVVHAFISSRLDYCNSLLFSISDNLLRSLQAVQNAVARLVTGTWRCELSTSRPSWLDRDYVTTYLSIYVISEHTLLEFHRLLKTHFVSLRTAAPIVTVAFRAPYKCAFTLQYISILLVIRALVFSPEDITKQYEKQLP